MARPVTDITWQKFWRLTALHFDKDKHTNRWWKCDCGNTVVISKSNVVRFSWRRVTKSCWCLLKECNNSFWDKIRTHWMTWTHFFRKYDWIIGRCNRPTHNKFYLRWWKWIKCLRNSFSEFMNDMYDSYIEHVNKFGQKNTYMDRIDSNWHYCKENCRWVTISEQNNNLSTNIMITHKWKTQSPSSWSIELWIPHQTIRWRFRRWVSIENISNN